MTARAARNARQGVAFRMPVGGQSRQNDEQQNPEQRQCDEAGT